MIISMVVAKAENGVIGRDGDLPWRIPADLKYFKAITMGKPIIMGRKTYESIRRPLPGRKNIVITRDRAWRADGVAVAHSLEEAVTEAGAVKESMIIGGAEIYRQALAQTGRIYLTEVHTTPDGDTVFPAIDTTEWRETSREDHPATDGNPAFSFVTLERV